MAPIVSTIEVARPPEEVYRYVTDPSRFAEWQPDVVRVDSAAGPLGVGARFTTVRRISGTERTIVQEVTEARPVTSWVTHGVDGPIRPHAVVTIEPLSGGAGSRVTFSLDYEGHGIGVPLIPLVRRLTRGQAPKSYQNLKNLLEGGSADPE